MVDMQGRRQGKDAGKRRNVGKARMMGRGEGVNKMETEKNYPPYLSDIFQ